MTKSNWACSACGRGFGRRSSAKRHVNTVHRGYASYLSWTDYVAGRGIGLYPPGEPPRKGTPEYKPTYSERMMDTMHEGFFNEMGRILARQQMTPVSYRLPSFAQATQYVTTPYFGEHVFAIHAYICSNCLSAKPSTLCFIEGDQGGSRHYSFYCPASAAKDLAEYGGSKKEFISRARIHCTNVLVPSVSAWMGAQPELIAVEIEDPNRYVGRITFLRKDGDRIFSITLDYSEERCINLDAATTGGWAARALAEGRTVLNQTELSEFLGMTETISYGFFKLRAKKRSRTFLMAVAKSGSNMQLQVKDESMSVSEKIDGLNRPRDDAGQMHAASGS